MFAAMPTEFEPIFDQTRVNPGVGVVKAALNANDWSRAKDVFAGLNPYEQQLSIELVDDAQGCDGFLEALLSANPRDSLAATMLARRRAVVGRQIRGTLPAAQVPPEDWKIYRDKVHSAEELLTRTCAINPSFVPAWTTRIRTASYMGYGIPEVKRRFARVERYSPQDLYAQIELLVHLAPKWHGSLEQTHEFAWRCVNSSVPGSAAAALLVSHYQLRWWYSEATMRDIFTEPQVRQEILTAANQSVMNPAFTFGAGSVWALTQFAYAFACMEDWPRAWNCFARLGDYACIDSWSETMTNPGSTFTELRKEVVAHQ